MKLAKYQLQKIIQEELVNIIQETDDYKLFQEGKLTEAEFMNKLRGMGKWAKGAALGAGMLGSLGAATLPASQAQAATPHERSDRTFLMLNVMEALQDMARGFGNTEQIKRVHNDKRDMTNLGTAIRKVENLQESDPELFNHYISLSKTMKNSYGDQLTDENIKDPQAAAALGLLVGYTSER